MYRLGWYNGAGGRRIVNAVTVAGTKQSIPAPAPTTGLVECNWINPYTLTTSPTWTSGVYVAKLTASGNGEQSYIIFVVRDDSSTSDYLFQSSVTTYQAYNGWGGKALYADHSADGIAAVKVSFNRPYGMGPNSSAAPGVGAGEFITAFAPSYETFAAAWEYNTVRFLEREGYDVTYCTDIDTHAHGDTLLLNHAGFLSVGHDEYWSWEMRTNVEAARDAGVSLAFLGANACYWQVRFEADSKGAPNRTMVGYKASADTKDPYALDGTTSNDYLITRLWRNNSVKPPEDAMVGEMYVTDPVNGNLVIEDASNWVCANTGLRDGDSILGLVGYEVDCMAFDAPDGTARIGHSTYSFSNGDTVYPDLTVYTASSGATVFATGSMQWNWALDDYNSPNIRPSYVSSAAQQMMRNVLASFVGDRPVVTPPAATVPFADNFADNVTDSSKWRLGAIQATFTGGSGAWDTNVSVAEQNQRVQVTPRARTNGYHYNGYVSASARNLTNAGANVEVVQTAAGNAQTYLAASADNQNFYKIEKEGSGLYFTQVLGGIVTEVSIPYDAAAHRFWQIRHIKSTDSIVFETSRDGQIWTIRYSLRRFLSVNALNIEVGAGTNQSITSPGSAIFDNFALTVRSTTLPANAPAQEAVSAPTQPAGSGSGYTGTAYSYSTGGSVDSQGASVQYLFDWGDGTNSGWLASGVTSASKTWTTKGTYTVRSQARSVANTGVISPPSPEKSVTIAASETVSTPSRPSGPTTGSTGTAYTYSTGAAVDNLGHAVQYNFNWGNGTNSGWLAVGTTSAQKTWTAKGNYTITVTARCATHTSVISSSSTGLAISIGAGEAVSAPSKPTGPTSGYTGTTYAYSTGGAADNLGHSVQYLFKWGDGTNSGWLPVGTRTAYKSWTSKGSFTVQAVARCATHTSVVSANSTGLPVSIALGESVSAPTKPTGPTAPYVGTTQTYATGGAKDNFGHSIQYLFDWGDGSNSGWLPVGTTRASKYWKTTGSFGVRTRARCATHTTVLSPYSATLNVNVTTVFGGGN